MNECVIASLLPPPGWGASGAFPWNPPVFRVFLWNADEMRSFRHSSNNCSGTGKLVLALNFHKLESSRKTDTENIFLCTLTNQNCWVSHGCSAQELCFLRGCCTCWLTQQGKIEPTFDPILCTACTLQGTWGTVPRPTTPAESPVLMVTFKPERTIPVLPA